VPTHKPKKEYQIYASMSILVRKKIKNSGQWLVVSDQWSVKGKKR
jgi:hypothetical protein